MLARDLLSHKGAKGIDIIEDPRLFFGGTHHLAKLPTVRGWLFQSTAAAYMAWRAKALGTYLRGSQGLVGYSSSSRLRLLEHFKQCLSYNHSRARPLERRAQSFYCNYLCEGAGNTTFDLDWSVRPLPTL